MLAFSRTILLKFFSLQRVSVTRDANGLSDTNSSARLTTCGQKGTSWCAEVMRVCTLLDEVMCDQSITGSPWTCYMQPCRAIVQFEMCSHNWWPYGMVLHSSRQVLCTPTADRVMPSACSCLHTRCTGRLFAMAYTAARLSCCYGTGS